MRYVLVKFCVGVVANHYNTCTAHPMLVYDRDENATVINPRYFCRTTGGLRRVGDILMRRLISIHNAYSYNSFHVDSVRRVRYKAKCVAFEKHTRTTCTVLLISQDMHLRNRMHLLRNRC